MTRDGEACSQEVLETAAWYPRCAQTLGARPGRPGGRWPRKGRGLSTEGEDRPAEGRTPTPGTSEVSGLRFCPRPGQWKGQHQACPRPGIRQQDESVSQSGTVCHDRRAWDTGPSSEDAEPTVRACVTMDTSQRRGGRAGSVDGSTEETQTSR